MGRLLKEKLSVPMAPEVHFLGFSSLAYTLWTLQGPYLLSDTFPFFCNWFGSHTVCSVTCEKSMAS